MSNDNNLKNYLLSDFQDIIFDNQKILENKRFMKKYWKEIYQNFKDTPFYLRGMKTTTIQRELYEKLISIIQFEQEKYNHWYDNILQYWLLEFKDLILFTRLMYLYFAPYWENRAISVLENKIVFWWFGRVKTIIWEIGEIDIEIENKEAENKEEIETIEGFVKSFGYNKGDLENLKIQFQEIINENKREERDIRRSKYYIWLIDELIICWKKQEITKKHEK